MYEDILPTALALLVEGDHASHQSSFKLQAKGPLLTANSIVNGADVGLFDLLD